MERSMEGEREAGKKARLSAAVPISVARTLRKRMTPQEVKLWVKLRAPRPAGFHFRRQVPIGAFVVDFACMKHRLIVEVDGGQHSFDGHVASDRARDAVLRGLGFRVLRFWNAEVDADLDSIIDAIFANLDQAIPPLQGRADSDAAAFEPGGALARSANSKHRRDPTPVAAATRPSPEGEG
jgi:very-short-patch-repair endonuclease